MKRRTWFIAVALLAVMLAAPAAVAAQQELAVRQGGFLLRVDGDLTLGPSEIMETVIVINGDVMVEGEIESLIVIEGTATLAGTVDNLTVFGGAAELLAGATVTENVNAFDSDVTTHPAATIAGDINRGAGFSFWFPMWIAWFFVFLGVTLALIVMGLIAAGVAPRQLREAGTLITEEPPKVTLGALVVAIGAPIVMVLTLITVIGIPLAITIFLVTGAIATAGYLVTAARVGDVIVGNVRGRMESGHPYGAVVVGVLILQAIAFVPVFGTIAWIVAQLAGVGAIALMAWRSFRAPVTPEAGVVEHAPAA
jgi:hypothetical protein